MNAQRPSLPVGFLVASGVVACFVLGLYLWIIAVDWFIADDFAFLTYVQRPWSWAEVFLPLQKRFWWAYRPVGMDAYFYLSFKTFGWNAQGFFAVTLLAWTLSGALAFRIGRQLGLDLRVAVFAALLGVSRFSSINHINEACCFHYAAAVLCQLAAVTCFFSFYRTRRVAWQTAGCAALLLGLLSNEFNLIVPVLLLFVGWFEEGYARTQNVAGRILLRASPYFAVAGAFLVVRYGVIVQVERPSLYILPVGPHIATNSFFIMKFVAGSGIGLSAATALMVLSAALLSRGGETRGAAWTAMNRALGVCAPWALLTVLPLSAIPFPQDRFALPLQIPSALVFGVFMHGLWQRYGGRFRRTVEVGLVVLLLLSLPLGSVFVRASFPRGALMREFQKTVRKKEARLREGTYIRILYGGMERADHYWATEYRAYCFGGAAIYSMYPERRILVDFKDVGREPLNRILCNRCVYFNLLPSLLVEPVSGRKLKRELSPNRGN